MRTTTTRTTAAAAALALLAGACLPSSNGATLPDDDAVEQPQPADDPETAPASGDGRVPAQTVELDLELQHFTGTVARIERLEVDAFVVNVDVDIYMPTECRSACPFGFAFQMLNHRQQGGGMYLAGDDGTTYPLIPVDGNTSLEMSPGERLQGTLAFQGPLERGTSTLALRINPDRGFDERSQYDTILPRFDFDPVELAGE